MIIEKPFISVIINCFNSDKYLREAIDSVYKQTYTHWEIIFYDNNSSDDSAVIANSYDARLNYVKRDTTIPLAQARNEAAEYAQGDYIAFLDCDDVWLPNKLELLIKAAEQHSNVGLVYSDTSRIDSSGRDMNLPYSCGRQLKSGYIYLDLLRDCFIACSTALITREAFMRSGGMSAKYNQVEDWELWLKIARDYQVILVDEILVKTRIHAQNVSRNVLEHLNEKIDLISHFSALTPEHEYICKKTLSELRSQRSLITFLNKRREGLIAALAQLFIDIFKAPLGFYRVMRRYFTPNMLRLYFRKFS